MNNLEGVKNFFFRKKKDLQPLNKEQEGGLKKFKNGIVNDLQQKVLVEGFFENPEKKISEQRKEEIEKEVGDVAKIFNEYGKQWFLTGGTSLELRKNDITRDHLHCDVVLYYDDVADFFDYMQKIGYKFVETTNHNIPYKERREIKKEELLQKRNAFTQKIDENKSGPQGFRVMFLYKNEKGEAVFGADDRLTFPTISKENVEKYKAKNEQEVPIFPAEIQLLYKFFMGREKDFQDIKSFLPTLNKEEQERFSKYTEILLKDENNDTRMYFHVERVEETVRWKGYNYDVDEDYASNFNDVLKLAEEATEEIKKEIHFNYLAQKEVDRMMSNLDKLFEITKQINFEDLFINQAKSKLGYNVISSEQKVKLKEIFDYISQNKPGKEKFIEFVMDKFGLQKVMEENLRKEFLEKKRWEVYHYEIEEEIEEEESREDEEKKGGFRRGHRRRDWLG